MKRKAKAAQETFDNPKCWSHNKLSSTPSWNGKWAVDMKYTQSSELVFIDKPTTWEATGGTSHYIWRWNNESAQSTWDSRYMSYLLNQSQSVPHTPDCSELILSPLSQSRKIERPHSLTGSPSPFYLSAGTWKFCSPQNISRDLF